MDVLMDEYKTWNEVPDNLKTRTQLGEMGLKPAKGQQPAAIKTSRHYRTPDRDLFDVTQAVPKRKMSEAQAAALEQARIKAMTTTCCNRYVGDINWKYKNTGMCEACYWEYLEREHRRFLARAEQEAAEWARGVLADTGAVILDTETTGLEYGDVIIEVSVIDAAGNVLLDTLVQPLEAIPEAASNIHGITGETCQDAPAWADVAGRLRPLLESASRVIVYNAEYDERMIYQTCAAAGLDTNWIGSVRFECAMMEYARWYGDWSEWFQSFKWQRLNGGHRALGDCQATLGLVKQMAKTNEAKKDEAK